MNKSDEENQWLKVLSFATSAGDTITEAEALEVIRSIARQMLEPHRILRLMFERHRSESLKARR